MLRVSANTPPWTVIRIILGFNPDELLKANPNGCMCERQCQRSIFQPAVRWTDRCTDSISCYMTSTVGPLCEYEVCVAKIWRKTEEIQRSLLGTLNWLNWVRLRRQPLLTSLQHTHTGAALHAWPQRDTALTQGPDKMLDYNFTMRRRPRVTAKEGSGWERNELNLLSSMSPHQVSASMQSNVSRTVVCSESPLGQRSPEK